jgi:hypothetical protein
MKQRSVVLCSLVFLIAACGPDNDVGVPSTTPPGSPVVVAPVGEPESPALAPDQTDASPEPISEPTFKPVPAPAPAPASKPPRPNHPMPPPPRPRPGIPSTIPAPPPVEDDARLFAAVSNLADRLDLDPADVVVLDARDVTWRDGTAGCPEPGLAYSQAEIPGFLIVLEVDGASYRYHSAGERMPFLCRTPEGPLEGSA